MALRGEAHRAAIRAVLDAFGADARHFVFIGGCTLGLYARSDGAPLRATATKDVDCISTLVPWVLQEKLLGDMCSRGVLLPDGDLQCRYRIRGTELDSLREGDLPDLVDWHLDSREATHRDAAIAALGALVGRRV